MHIPAPTAILTRLRLDIDLHVRRYSENSWFWILQRTLGCQINDICPNFSHRQYDNLQQPHIVRWLEQLWLYSFRSRSAWDLLLFLLWNFLQRKACRLNILGSRYCAQISRIPFDNVRLRYRLHAGRNTLPNGAVPCQLRVQLLKRLYTFVSALWPFQRFPQVLHILWAHSLQDFRSVSPKKKRRYLTVSFSTLSHCRVPIWYKSLVQVLCPRTRPRGLYKAHLLCALHNGFAVALERQALRACLSVIFSSWSPTLCSPALLCTALPATSALCCRTYARCKAVGFSPLKGWIALIRSAA